MSRIVVAGGSGFLGRALAARLTAGGDDVVVLTRTPKVTGDVAWQPDGSARVEWANVVDGADAIVNLTGEDIAGRRWTDARREALRDSRVLPTRSLIAAVRAASHKPATFIQASGAGYYGMTGGDQVFDESFPPGSDFLGQLCVNWEAEAHAATALGCRLVLMRSGVVLAKGGSILGRLRLPFLLFGGGPVASGRQYLSWIHRDDWIAMLIWALRQPLVVGAINATSPEPVTNEVFMAAYGRALSRPSWLRMPGFALELIFGEMADAVLINGQRVVPRRAMDLKFTFTYPRVDAAMRASV